MSKFRSLVFLVSAMGITTLSACSNTQESTSVPSTSGATPSAAAQHHAGMGMGHQQININNAILSQLDKFEAQLGIPSLSNKIQASRPYGKPEELVTKGVITQAQFDQIKDMVTVEEIQLTGEAKDIDYMTKLGLMKGHLLVAKELLDLKKPDQAEPHIGHPVEEIYADVEDQLNERKVKEFKAPLIDLQDLVKAGAKDSAAVNTKFEASTQAIDDAIAALPETRRNDQKFVLSVINGLLDTANSEYKAAIAGGKISQAIEYQDSRGFVEYANGLYKTIAPSLQKSNPSFHQSMVAAMTNLKTAWPSPLPPAAPVKTPEAVSTLIKEIETNTQKITRSASANAN